MADKVTKICMDIYRKLEKSRVLNIIERLQISNILEICYLYNLQWKYVKKYISIQVSIFLFVSSVLNCKSFTFLQKFIFVFSENTMTNATAIPAHGGHHYSDRTCVCWVIWLVPWYVKGDCENSISANGEIRVTWSAWLAKRRLPIQYAVCHHHTYTQFTPNWIVQLIASC
jgi:hypothetical protein